MKRTVILFEKDYSWLLALAIPAVLSLSTGVPGGRLVALLLALIGTVIACLRRKGVKAVCGEEGILLKDDDSERFLYREELQIEYQERAVILHCGSEQWVFPCSSLKQSLLEDWEAKR